MKAKFHKNCEKIILGKILKISCVRCTVILWNLTFTFSGSHKKFSLVLLQMTNITSLASENVKKNAICFKLFWFKVFVDWKLKLLNYQVDSVLNPLQVCFQKGLQTFIQCLLVKREFKSHHYNILHYILCLEAVALRVNNVSNNRWKCANDSGVRLTFNYNL